MIIKFGEDILILYIYIKYDIMQFEKTKLTTQNSYPEVDMETGEVRTTVETNVISTTRRVRNYNEFIMVYLDDMSSILRLENATQIKLLSLIWRDIAYSDPNSYDGNTITIVKAHKDKWAEEIGVTPSTISNALTVLVKKDILTVKARSIYELNPLYFFKGLASDRKKLLKRELIYEVDGSNEFE